MNKTISKKDNEKNEKFDKKINLDEIDYLAYDISTGQNMDKKYVETGIITLCDVQGLNIIRRNISKIKNAFGQSGINTYIYNYCVNSILKKVKIEMEKHGIDKITNAKIKFILPQKLKKYKYHPNISGGNDCNDIIGGTINLTQISSVNIFFLGTGLKKI